MAILTEAIKIYIDINGEKYYSFNKIRKKLQNQQGPVKVDSLKDFQEDMVEIKNPYGLAKFICEELDIVLN